MIPFFPFQLSLCYTGYQYKNVLITRRFFMRLDKFLANAGIGTRSEVKQYLKKGMVQVNGQPVKKGDLSINENTDQILFQNRPVEYEKYYYYMLNKPQGVVSATEDNFQKTVLDLMGDCRRDDLFPVGRLDKDTEGLLLITNDGALAHRLLSPKKHVSKIYFARIEGKVTDEDVQAFKTGLVIDDIFTALPANLRVLKSDAVSEIEVEIFEGKFHQVKRMFQAVGKKVVFLKRLSMGTLELDPALKPGEFRPLTEAELKSIS